MTARPDWMGALSLAYPRSAMAQVDADFVRDPVSGDPIVVRTPIGGMRFEIEAAWGRRYPVEFTARELAVLGPEKVRRRIVAAIEEACEPPPFYVE